FVAATLRFALASAIILPFMLKKERGLPRIARKDLFLILSISFFGNFLYSIFLLYGLKLTGATESGIIAGCAPIVTIALASLFLHEPLGRRKFLGIVLVILGISAINLGSQNTSGGTHSLIGDLLICGSVLCEALWTLLGKAVSPKVSPLAIAALTTFSGFAMFFPLGIYQAMGSSFQSLSSSGWFALLYYGSIGTVGAYILWYQGIPRVPASIAGMFAGIIPVSAVLLSSLFLREPFVGTQLLGIFCVLAALFCVTTQFSWKRKAEKHTI
ncbi:MAG TPA: DMT family transporter, partial [Ktedonobacteraceae bacterium]|nr:DMT family transporter [Ktedonobacteraceae bacterium]